MAHKWAYADIQLAKLLIRLKEELGEPVDDFIIRISQIELPEPTVDVGAPQT